MDYEDYVERDEESCPKCGGETYTRTCGQCEDGVDGHDCGEDCCCCEYPEPNQSCDLCLGRGYFHWCKRCGWDLVEKRFINGKDERTPVEIQEDAASRICDLKSERGEPSHKK